MEPLPRFLPSLDPCVVRERLARILREGPVTDGDLERRMERLDERFAAALRHLPALWAPGLLSDGELERKTEEYLSAAEIAGALRRLLFLSFHPPFRCRSVPLESWLRFLHELEPLEGDANPGRFLRTLAADAAARERLIFSLSLPRRHGGAFGRYPVQESFIAAWFGARGKGAACLDAACGSGEGAWDLARIAAARGIGAGSSVHGSSRDLLEVFSSAHAWFPHDPPRQGRYRRSVEGVAASGCRMLFYVEDLEAPSPVPFRYDLIRCNGLLGGPSLHDPGRTSRVVEALAERLHPGGILLAADTFHEGWRKRLSQKSLEEMLLRAGLRPLQPGEGVGGQRM